MNSVENSKIYRLYGQVSSDDNSTNFIGLFMLSFIIRFLSNNGRKFALYIDSLNKKLDINLLSEIWFEKTNIDILPGYK